jgi:dienelactone hydrolase
MRKFAWVGPLLWLACASTPAIAQNTGTLTVTGLHSSQGSVAAALCSDAGGQFRGPCGEKINGPMLLLSGRADALWPSTDMSERLVKRLQDKGFEHSVQHLSYEGAGHLVFVGDPTRPAAQAMAKAPPNAMLGGTSAANAAAWADNWPKTLAFFDKALKRTR